MSDPVLTEEELNTIKDVFDGKIDELPYELYEKLFEHYCNNGEMPYGIAKARDGDPMQWIGDRLVSILISNGRE